MDLNKAKPMDTAHSNLGFIDPGSSGGALLNKDGDLSGYQL